MHSETLPITLIVLTYDEKQSLLELFRKIFAEPASGRPSEVVLVHNGGLNPTLNWVRQAQQLSPIPFCLEVAPENNLGRSRAWAVQRATQPLVAFIDGDCRPPQAWLGHLYQQWLQISPNDPKCVGVGAPNRLDGESPLGATLNLMLSSPLGHGGSAQGHQPSEPRLVDHLPTTNALFLRSAILEVGNFSAKFSRTCEDVELGLRLGRQGFHLQLTDRPLVTNNCVQTWREWATRMFRFGSAQSCEVSPHRQEVHWPSVASAGGVLIAMALPVLGFIFPPSIWVIPAYGLLLTLESWRLCRRSRQAGEFFRLAGAFALTHWAYGLGSAWGFFHRLRRRPSPSPSGSLDQGQVAKMS